MMSSIHEMIYMDSHLSRMSIRIEPAGVDWWIERFIQNCTSVAATQRVLDALQAAFESNAAWHCNYNDMLAEYDPNRQLILARHELEEIRDPALTAMAVNEFIRILTTWRDKLDSQEPTVAAKTTAG